MPLDPLNLSIQSFRMVCLPVDYNSRLMMVMFLYEASRGFFSPNIYRVGQFSTGSIDASIKTSFNWTDECDELIHLQLTYR